MGQVHTNTSQSLRVEIQQCRVKSRNSKKKKRNTYRISAAHISRPSSLKSLSELLNAIYEKTHLLELYFAMLSYRWLPRAAWSSRILSQPRLVSAVAVEG